MLDINRATRTHALAFREWELWKALCQELADVRAVTSSDLTSSPAERDTPGQKLFASIREWGEALADLRTNLALDAIHRATARDNRPYLDL
jgi:hypothetical protein